MFNFNTSFSSKSRDYMERLTDEIFDGFNNDSLFRSSTITSTNKLKYLQDRAENGVTLIQFALPGHNKNTVSIFVERNDLVVRSRKDAKLEKLADAFEKRLRLSSVADKNGIDAEFKDGILTIKIPTLDTKTDRKSVV